jgi:hypothetical protein
MPEPYPADQYPANPFKSHQRPPCLQRMVQAAALSCALCFSAIAAGQSVDVERRLAALGTERQALTRELAQYRATVALLQTDGIPPSQSADPAVRRLADAMTTIRERLVDITEREVTLLQRQITAARTSATTETPPPGAIETKPLRTTTKDYTLAEEAENVARLRALLAGYYAELKESALSLPSEQERLQREEARRDAERIAKIPFSPDKVRLNGFEGSTALAQITRRLADPDLPESRRDVAPICSIKTRLFGSLVGSENRSLQPVGKSHYIARIRLQPGDTTLYIQGDRWEVQLPRDVSAQEFLITLYRPPGGSPELHVFSVDELLAEDDPHIPAWLPDNLQLDPGAG